MIYENILQAVGHTPLVKLNKIGKELPVTFYAKVEYLNPGGSIKDRIALSMIDQAEREGVLKPGGVIIEATAGNTGVGLALVSAVKGYRCIFVMPDKMSEDKINLLKSYGAEVIVTPTNVPPDSPESYNGVADRLSREISGSFRPNQFANRSNIEAHYQTTGPELWEETKGKIDVFVGSVGTGGTVSGTGRFLKEKNPKIKVVIGDPEGSIISGVMPGASGSWLVEGIGEDFIPATYDRQVVDETIKISDREAFLLARRLAREEGLLVGGSSGYTMAAALRYAARYTQPANFVIIFPDTGRNYLSKMFNDAWMQAKGFLEQPKRRVVLKEILDRKKNHHKMVTVTAGRPVQEGVALLHEHDISQLPVLDGERMVGSLAEATVMKLVHDGKNLVRTLIRDVMGRPFPELEMTTDANEAYRLLMAGNDAVVVSDKGKPEGIVTRMDLVDFWSVHD